MRDLFAALLAASAELGIDDELVAEARRRAAAASAGPHRPCGPAPGVARRLGHGRAGDRPPARLAPLWPLSRATRSTSTGRPSSPAAARRSLEIRGDDATGWGIGWRHQSLGAAPRRRPCPRRADAAAVAGADLSEPVRRAPAVPDRRQFRRGRRHSRNAACSRARGGCTCCPHCRPHGQGARCAASARAAAWKST